VNGTDIAVKLETPSEEFQTAFFNIPD
jgi:hypothetical protein